MQFISNNLIFLKMSTTKLTVKRVTKPMPAHMKKMLREQKYISEVNARIRANQNRELVEPDKVPLILPMGFTGRDLKRAKSMLKKYREQRG